MLYKSLVSLFVLAFATTAAFGAVTFYTDQPTFNAANAAAGNVLFGLDNFEEHNLPPNTVWTANPPGLRFGVPNLVGGQGYPAGLTLQDLEVSSVVYQMVVALTTGFMGLPSTGVGPNYFSDTTLLNEYVGDKVAMGMVLSDLAGTGTGTATVNVYDTGGNLIGNTPNHPCPPGAGQVFLGIISDVPIGSATIAGNGGGAEIIDNVETWVPEPASLALLALGALVLVRRR